MREKALTHIAKFGKRPCVNQALALLLCAATLLGLMQTNALAASSESGSISGVSEPDPSVYTVDIGTELAGVGLPAGLEITVTAEENASSVRTEPVEWLGDYNKDIAGEYTLTAAFTDDTLVFSPMPTVRVTVSEAASAPQDLLTETAALDAPKEASGGEQPRLLGDGDVNQGIVCALTPKKSIYNTGEIIQFNLDTQFANPGTGVGRHPSSLAFRCLRRRPRFRCRCLTALARTRGTRACPCVRLPFRGRARTCIW